jgi:hypothetical protein
MLDFLLSLPTWSGCSLAMASMAIFGLVVHFVSSRLFAKFNSDNVKDAALSLFGVLAILVSLLLSLAFGDVISDLVQIRNAVEREVLAIKEAYIYSELYDIEKTSEIRALLVEYVQTVIEDDWPDLANDRLSPRTDKVHQQITNALINLVPNSPMQEKLHNHIMDEIDLMSDYRFMRFENALSAPPVYVLVIAFGLFIQMTCYGAYRSEAPVNLLVILYCLFVGLILYLILTLSDPFQGIGVEPTNFKILIEKLRSVSG